VARQFPTPDPSSSETRVLAICTYLNQVDARNLLVVSVSQISEEQLF
jgi:hypothetical protein